MAGRTLSPILLTIPLLAAWPALAGDGGPGARDPYLLSPPAGGQHVRQVDTIETNLRELRDAHGLAILTEDEGAVRILAKLLAQQEKNFAKLLGEDPELAAIDDRAREVFRANLNGRNAPAAQVAREVMAIPTEELHRTLILWLKSLYHRKGIYFPADLDRADRATLTDLCAQTQAYDTRKGLPTWRYRVLLWRWRDTQAIKLMAARDERLAFLAPLRFKREALGPAGARALDRYLAMLRNLKLEVLRNRANPYEVHRTLSGLVRGLRYMEDIHAAAEATGLDFKLMVGLYIQESEFVHQRVSVAGAFSIAQFLNIAVKDVWLFRSRIPGSQRLLKGVSSWEDLKQKMIADPRMAIRASCLYFRRVRDGIVRHLAKEGQPVDTGLVDLLTLEMVTLRRGVMQRSLIDTQSRLEQFWPARSVLPVPVVPLGGAVVPEPASMLERFVEKTVRELVEVRISEQVFQDRLARLQSALGLASYNAGTGTLLKTGKRKHPYQALSFPIHIDETRGYVDGIMDSWTILEQVDRLTSGVSRMHYDDLMRLAHKACRMSKLKPNGKSKDKPEPTKAE